MRLMSLLAGLSVSVAATPVYAQTSHYAENGKLMRAPQALGVLGDNLFGDKVNFYSGSLEFIQNDVSIPGNSVLPVSVGRRLRPATGYSPDGHFGNWDLEIPHLHGVFANGWITGLGTDRTLRCSKFGAPPDAQSDYTNNPGLFRNTEFWHGNFIYVPGQGDQELLRRSTGNNLYPGTSTSSVYPVVTRHNWQVSCITSGGVQYFVAL